MRQGRYVSLELQLGEEPLVLTSLVLFFQGLTNNLLGFFSLRWFLQSFVSNSRLERFNIKGVSGRHQVVVVNQLNKWLNSGSLSGLLGTQVLGNLQRSSFDTDNNGMGEWVSLGTVIVRLHNDNLLTGVSTTNDNSYKVNVSISIFNGSITRVQLTYKM